MWMSDVVVADAGPLIALARIGQLELLRALYARVVVPHAVWREATVDGGPTAAGASTIVAATWIDRVAAPSLEPATAGLGDGESEAISVAAQMLPDVELLCDDKPARNRARALSIPVVGTLAILARGKRGGFLVSVRVCLDGLQANGMYLDAALVHELLADVGEAER